MATFISGFAKGFSNARDRSLKREMFLGEQQEKKSRAMGAVLPKVQEFQERLKLTQTRMDYLESRGLDDKTLNVLYSDPEALDTAYSLLSTNGADWDPETVGTYVRAAANTKIPDVSWKDHLNQSFDWFSGMDIEAMTPESVISGMASLQPDPTGVAEFKPVPKPKNEGEAGLSATEDRTYKYQRSVFDQKIIDTAQSYLNSLLSDPSSDPDERALLQRDMSEYGKSQNSTTRLFERFGAQTIDHLKNNLAPEHLTGLEYNGLLPQITVQEDGTQVVDASEESLTYAGSKNAPEGGVHVATGTDPSDGVLTYIYRMPDGSLVHVKE
jgi:hypothetical protein